MKILVVCTPPDRPAFLKSVDAEPIDVGVVKGELAVHPHLLYNHGYSVTNTKTGMALVWFAPSREAAVRDAGKALKELGPVRYAAALKHDRRNFLSLKRAHLRRRVD